MAKNNVCVLLANMYTWISCSYAEVRVQFAERLHTIDQQTENRLHLLQEVQEFLKRRAELETDYARNLDRLVDRFYGRLRPNTSCEQVQALPATCWQLMLSQVRREGRDHAKLGELYSSDVVLRLSQLVDDTNRLSRKVWKWQEINITTPLLQTFLCACRISATFLQILPDLFGLFPAKINTFQLHYGELQILLYNLIVFFFFLCAVFPLPRPQLCNLGFYACLTRTFRTYLSAEYGLNESRNQSLDLLENGVNKLEAGAHRARFLESTAAGNTNSMAPPVFLFQTHTGDEVCQITAQEPIQSELVTRYEGIKQRLTGLRTENEEVKKTMDASMQYLHNLVNTDDYNVSSSFQDLDPEGSPVKKTILSRNIQSIAQLRTMTNPTLTYLQKFKTFMATSNVITKLQAKQELIQKTLGEGETEPPSIPPKPTKCKRLRPCSRVPISLFCGDLDSYIKESGQTIPLVVESCVRYINLYGLQHEGIFRVPGSQAEVNKLRNAFERGEDPLEDGELSYDIDSVAGVLKLYFRTLQTSMFPKCMLSDFLACNKQTEQLLKLVSDLPLTKIIVLRFLFAFLSHLSHFRDENMMDPSNLAICFGPTLMPVPEDLDPVACQPHVNDIITAIITHHEAVFPGPDLLPGPLYEMVAKIDCTEHLPHISDDWWKSRPSRVEHDSCAMQVSTHLRTRTVITFRNYLMLLKVVCISKKMLQVACYYQDFHAETPRVKSRDHKTPSDFLFFETSITINL
uniref:Rho-GAP domain-containing protein n=1 Tax=Eptatretus burgeri TaxID=7764 RepID=A0A8C4PZ89_EPTBU